MRIALLMQLAPRKLGSFERWVLAFAKAARQQGHALDVYGCLPVHSAYAQELESLGAGSYPLASLKPGSPSTLRRLASYDVLHLNLLAPRAPPSLMAYAAWPARVIFVDHTSGDGSTQHGILGRLADRVTFFRAAQVLGVSDFVTLRDRVRFGLGSTRSRTVYNGVVVPPSCRPRVPGPLRIIAVAYLIPEKGVHHLIAALERVRGLPFRLQVVGDGPQRSTLRSLARELGLQSQVEFLGLRDDVPALMEQADLFVHPARWAEAFGLTVAEAMAAGCAVVASRVGAMPELIEDGRTGLLFEPGNETQLAAIIERLAHTPEERARLGEAAWLEATARFTVERSVNEHLGVCEGVARPAPGEPVQDWDRPLSAAREIAR